MHKKISHEMRGLNQKLMASLNEFKDHTIEKVLISSAGASIDLIESDYFNQIITLKDFLGD